MQTHAGLEQVLHSGDNLNRVDTQTLADCVWLSSEADRGTNAISEPNSLLRRTLFVPRAITASHNALWQNSILKNCYLQRIIDSWEIRTNESCTITPQEHKKGSVLSSCWMQNALVLSEDGSLITSPSGFPKGRKLWSPRFPFLYSGLNLNFLAAENSLSLSLSVCCIFLQTSLSHRLHQKMSVSVETRRQIAMVIELSLFNKSDRNFWKRCGQF